MFCFHYPASCILLAVTCYLEYFFLWIFQQPLGQLRVHCGKLLLSGGREGGKKHSGGREGGKEGGREEAQWNGE